ncbi:hypothetical protein SERLA73DRAFT_183906 [Serpula lacrymans var. lacrymans S7.3]|uniref:Hydrophobin n=2 Tax=Serpula lacrymans var. lacrymans TaxID=341189 RepID=F8Q239_SERL3|nr:hydrophobin [Serpula lacrymans var. lacrymans S7.9]EGN97250.1 hypothetical protein SERLA73DRAFT_183906 [Serpula lacrymans var. lacrymans S7.3]EGO22850.1 hydrophobin [Serpula lacrymans var. lacrymans S7.9]
MHAHLSIFLLVPFFASFAVAGPTFRPGNTTNHLPVVKDKPCANNITTKTTTTASTMCNTGTLQCCSSTQSLSDSMSLLSGLLPLGAVIEGLVGMGCSPILPMGVGSGTSCNQEPVCCSGDTFGGPSGILNLGCSPINALKL